MGVIRHHTIVVTSWDDERLGKHLSKAHKEAREVFGDEHVSPIMGPYTNGYGSFFVPPDGGKEGREWSDERDELRAQFIEWMQAQSDLDWIEVVFGGDTGAAHIANDSKRQASDESEGWP